MDTKEKVDAIVFGRKIGLYSGWDSVSDFVIILYDFEGVIDGERVSGPIEIDFDKGWIEMAPDKEGVRGRYWDISVVTKLPRPE